MSLCQRLRTIGFNKSGSASRPLVYIGLGSNLDGPASQLRHAAITLQQHPKLSAVRTSPVYRGKPMLIDGKPPDQPDYLNAVIEARTTLAPLELLDLLQSIEQQQGRQRLSLWGSRTLDLDLLLYGDKTIQSERLIVPHPGTTVRPFVLKPLQDLNPQLQIPGIKNQSNALLTELLRHNPASELEITSIELLQEALIR